MMIVVAGSYNQDLVWRTPQFPKAGETRTGLFSQCAGGKGFNQAMAAHRLASATLFIAAIGEDALGDNAMRAAEAEGLRCAWQRCADASTGNAAIWLDGNGQNQILVDLAANLLLSPAHIADQAEHIRSARILVLQQEANLAASLQALHIAKMAGVCSIVNPAPAHVEATALQALADILTPNESEFAAALHIQGIALDAGNIAQLDAATLHALARKLPCPVVIITLGQRGAVLSTPDGFREFTPAAVTVVDTSGAGDCFNGALAAELARGIALPEACEFAVKAASCKVMRSGTAFAMPSRAEVATHFG